MTAFRVVLPAALTGLVASALHWLVVDRISAYWLLAAVDLGLFIGLAIFVAVHAVSMRGALSGREGEGPAAAPADGVSIAFDRTATPEPFAGTPDHLAEQVEALEAASRQGGQNRGQWSDEHYALLIEAERARREHGMLQAVLAGMADGVAVIAKRQRILLWNRAAEQITGCLAKDLLGLPWRDHLPSSGPRDSPLKFSRCAGGFRTADARIVKPSGKVVWIRARISRLVLAAGSVDVVVFHDVSREREIDSLKGEIVRIVNHELRTPLANIRGFTSTLQRRGHDLQPAERQEFLDLLDGEAARLGRLVDSLLDLSVIERGGPKFARTTVDLRSVAKEVVGSFSGVREQHPIEVWFEDPPPIAVGDRNRIADVLVNLIANAAANSPEGSPVEITIVKHVSEVEIAVSDKGSGIPVDRREEVFQAFRKLRSESPGLGLGLYLSRQYVDAMGGHIWIDERVGPGTTVRIRLPAADQGRLLDPLTVGWAGHG